MSELYARFLVHVPTGGRILDAGCGSGRDTLYFLRHGFEVEAFDASAEMCRLASALTGQTVLQKKFEQIDSDSAFDGIWACASLLHVRRDNMDIVLQKLCRALKPEGVIFLSFKQRDEEWEQSGRFFNSYDEVSLRVMLVKHPEVRCQSVWISKDVRPQRAGEQWLNALLLRAPKNEP